ncbi:MAG TPA: nicotinate phosphoribosyltransferase [Steroidobacter sp.]
MVEQRLAVGSVDPGLLNPQRPPVSRRPEASALLTDLYQLTMLDAYYRLGMEEPAVFEFFVRRLPPARNFLVAAGLEQALEYLESLAFTGEELEWLASTRLFSPTLLERLESFRFTGDVFAMREGTVFFASEPVLRIVAPLPEAQLVESRIVNLLQYQTLVASKAARCKLVAGEAQLVDFGMRRAHGAEAALLASRASYLAGFDATATVEAARRFGIPVVGTMAHSFVQAHEQELQAFENFAACHPQSVTLLIDTYETGRGARRVAQLASELRSQGVDVKAVRIDSGDLGAEAKRVRDILDSKGFKDIRILVSGGVDEYVIAALREAKAPIDAFCVGTRLSASEDAPVLDCAYKLQQYAGRPCRKRSLWKETWPGPRQVYRQYDPNGRIGRDLLACADEAKEGKALLQQVMVMGHRLALPALEDLREYCKEELATLPVTHQGLERVAYAPVKVSTRQHALAAEVDRRLN